MSVSSGIISVPISVDDVAQLCWVQLRRTVNGQVQTLYSYDDGCLCGAKVGDTVPAFDSDGSWTVADRGEINRWARYKSVRYQQESEISYSQRASVYFGLDAKFVVNAGALMNDTVYGIMAAPSYANVGWEHNKPAGGAATPYRLNDFVKKASDTPPTWAGSLAGYNHNAPFPCTVNIDQSSGYVVSMGSDTYEVNIQAVSAVKFQFTNATGSDLCLQDFCDFSLETSTMKWRPVLQMFYPQGTTPWYQVTTPTATAGGTAMTSDRTTVLEVTTPTASRVLNQYYYVCLGIGCCDAGATQFPGVAATPRLFIAPFQRGVHFTPQFYYRLRFVNYFTHAIKVTEVWYWGMSGGVQTWKQATNSGGSQSFIVGSDILSGDIGIVMEITRTNVGVYFVPANSQLSVSPKLYIQAGEQIGSGSETPRDLYPQSANWINPYPNYILIAEDDQYATRSPKLTTIANAKLPHSITSSMTNTATYHMKSQIDSQGWVDVNTFSVRVSQS